MFNQDMMYFFSQSHIKHLRHFNNPFIKQIYSLKFFQRPGSILGQLGIQLHIGDHRVRATCYFTVLNAVLHFQISIVSSVRILLLLLNSLPNDKILDWSKSKVYADDKIKVTENLKFVL